MASTRPNQRLTRDTSNVPDPLDRSRSLVNRPPEFRDMSVPLQEQVAEHVGDAGTRAFGRPITMDDAVATRTKAIVDAIAASPTGIPEGVDWYSRHRDKIKDIHAASGIGASISIASAADASASASLRNSPDNELLGLTAGLHIHANPEQKVDVTPAHARAMSEFTENKKPFLDPSEHLIPGSHSLGHLNHRQLAALSHAATATHSKATLREAADAGHDVSGLKVGSLIHGEHAVPTSVSDVVGRVAGKPVATRLLRNLEGESLDSTWNAAPKLKSYRRGTSTASTPEDAYNDSVLARRRDLEKTPGQGILFSAAEETNFDPSTADTSTAEDYVMQSMTALGSAGGDVKKAREAQNKINVLKGPRGQGVTVVDLQPEEMFHSFNNEATSRAAQGINYSTFGPEGQPMTEHITNKAAQAISWTQFRRHELGEDTAYEAAKAEEAAQAKKAEAERIQNTPTLF